MTLLRSESAGLRYRIIGSELRTQHNEKNCGRIELISLANKYYGKTLIANRSQNTIFKSANESIFVQQILFVSCLHV
jgi:hypothetical protein